MGVISVIESPANAGQDDRFFRKSFLKTRVVVGVIGVLLPLVLVIGNRTVFGQSGILPTLSDYYHSDMRNWFVGSLWAIGSGLLVYLAARRNLADSVISFVAGLFAVGVALAARGSDDNHAVFVGETVAVLAFGFSWFLKGSELFNILREEHGLPPMLRPPDPTEPAAAKQAPASDAGTEGS
jgi:hypothetical protein